MVGILVPWIPGFDLDSTWIPGFDAWISPGFVFLLERRIKSR